MNMKDPKYLQWIRSRPCIFESARCQGPTEAHHATGAGMGLKTSDRSAMPLCTLHHRQRHDHTGPFHKMTKAERRCWEREMVVKYQAWHDGTDYDPSSPF